jgi:hypothetical protein
MRPTFTPVQIAVDSLKWAGPKDLVKAVLHAAVFESGTSKIQTDSANFSLFKDALKHCSSTGSIAGQWMCIERWLSGDWRGKTDVLGETPCRSATSGQACLRVPVSRPCVSVSHVIKIRCCVIGQNKLRQPTERGSIKTSNAVDMASVSRY